MTKENNYFPIKNLNSVIFERYIGNTLRLEFYKDTETLLKLEEKNIIHNNGILESKLERIVDHQLLMENGNEITIGWICSAYEKI